MRRDTLFLLGFIMLMFVPPASGVQEFVRILLGLFFFLAACRRDQ